MSSGHSSDDEPRMQFSADNDFENGQWIDGEFFYSKQKIGPRQTRDEQIYGVFQDASSGSDSESDDGARRKKRPRAQGSGHQTMTSSSTRGVSRGVVFVPGSAQAGAARSESGDAGGADKTMSPTPQAEEDSAVLQVKNIIKNTTSEVAASKNNDSFRNLLKQEDKKEQERAVAHQKRLSSVNTKDMGSWEKHTKGVGRKLLDKFGFKGRLGAKEDGISTAVEVKVRPSTMGLGFGDFVEASAMEVNKKLEAELRKEEYVPPPKKDRKGKDQEDTFTVEKRASSASWKKGSSKGDKQKTEKGRRVLFRDAMDLMKESDAAERKSLIVDMRGPTPKVVSDMKDVDTNNSDVANDEVQPKLGQELLYNINIMVEGTSRELDFEARRLRGITLKCTDLSNERSELMQIIERDDHKLDRLKKIHLILGRMERSIEVDSGNITVDDIFRAFRALKAEFPVEYNLLGITELIPHICRRMVSKKFSADWNPFEDPMLIADTFAPWFIGSTELDRMHLKETGADEPSPMSTSSVTPSLLYMVESMCLFRIRRCIAIEWNAKTDPESAVKLLSSLYGSSGIFISSKEFKNILSTAIMPRLTIEVEKWTPTTDTVPIHWWLHPWLPLLRVELSELYPDIRRKLGRALANWSPADDSALLLLNPWKGVFDDLSMDNLLQRSVVPKLVSCISGLPLDPQNTTAEHTKLFSSVLKWFKLVPSIHMISIMEGEFFPRWLQILSSWLTSEAPDFSEITQWYLGWKSLFPEEMLADDGIAVYFNHALELMQHTLGGSGASMPIMPSGVPVGCSYFEVFERRKKEIFAMKRLHELKQEKSGSGVNHISAATFSAHSTFKDLIEEFALRNGVPFMPRTGRLQEGKQVFQFGKSLCFLDQGVVFLFRKKQHGGSSWDPVTLEDMLAVS